MKTSLLLTLLVIGGTSATQAQRSLKRIDNIVVIYAENRSFDVLYGTFPGAHGLNEASAKRYPQLDRNGHVFQELPPIWTGLTAAGVTPPVTESQTAHLPNQPFGIDDPNGLNVVTRDLWHRFYENQMQIDGGKNDKFVAWADSGSLVMGHYDGSKLKMWDIAKQFTLADNFFMGAFGGSYMNHIWLICACVGQYPHADQSPAKSAISAVATDGKTLQIAANSPQSALDGLPKFVRSGAI
jgi:phospholipase C